VRVLIEILGDKLQILCTQGHSCKEITISQPCSGLPLLLGNEKPTREATYELHSTVVRSLIVYTSSVYHENKKKKKSVSQDQQDPLFTISLLRLNILYMFQALICSSSGGTVYTTIGIFFVRIYVGWLLTGLE
jgi:hypothetical protein